MNTRFDQVLSGGNEDQHTGMMIGMDLGLVYYLYSLEK